MRPRDDFGSQAWAWAWARHQNLLSWYIRPFFVLPLAYFSYRRSPWGIAGTLVALATSMFWFPKPAKVHPRVAEFLRMEQDYLTSGWTPAKILALPAVPLALGAFCLAFWRRSVGYGLLVIDTAALVKVLWSVAYGKERGRVIIVPALLGGLITNVALLWAMRRAGHRLTFYGAAAPQVDELNCRCGHIFSSTDDPPPASGRGHLAARHLPALVRQRRRRGAAEP